MSSKNKIIETWEERIKSFKLPQEKEYLENISLLTQKEFIELFGGTITTIEGTTTIIGLLEKESWLSFDEAINKIRQENKILQLSQKTTIANEINKETIKRTKVEITAEDIIKGMKLPNEKELLEELTFYKISKEDYETLKTIVAKPLGIAKRLSLAQGANELAVLLKTQKTYFGKSYTIEDLYMKLQPVLNKFGIILQYKIEFDKDAPINPLIYYPAKNKDISEMTIALTDEVKDIDNNKDVKDGNLVDTEYKEFKNVKKTSQLLGKTVVFYRFIGEWINADDKLDSLPFYFPIPVELKDQMSFDQALGSASTYAFRTNIAKQFIIPTPDSDADFETAPIEVKEALKSVVKDNEFSKTYNDIMTLDNKNAYVLEKENHFMTNLKPIFGDCNSFYDYLKFKYIENVRDIKARAAFRTELKNKYTEIYTKKIKGNKNETGT